MDLKEFYKFTWSKLILSIVLVVIPFLFFLSFFGPTDVPAQPWPLAGLIAAIFFWPFLLMLGIEKLIFTSVDWIHAKDIPFIILAFIINIIYIYSIASLIIYLIKKISAKRKLS